jgi:hemoglobin-like flavoprotein
LEQLGEQHHKRFRVAASYYPAVGKILLETLAQFLGPKWTPELEQAWMEAYEVISAAMLQGYSSSPSK